MSYKRLQQVLLFGMLLTTMLWLVGCHSGEGTQTTGSTTGGAQQAPIPGPNTPPMIPPDTGQGVFTKEPIINVDPPMVDLKADSAGPGFSGIGTNSVPKAAVTVYIQAESEYKGWVWTLTLKPDLFTSTTNTLDPRISFPNNTAKGTLNSVWQQGSTTGDSTSVIVNSMTEPNSKVVVYVTGTGTGKDTSGNTATRTLQPAVIEIVGPLSGIAPPGPKKGGMAPPTGGGTAGGKKGG